MKKITKSIFIKKIKKGGSKTAPDFSINYESENMKNMSFEILSKLIVNKDFLIDLDPNLFNAQLNQRKMITDTLVEFIKRNNFIYRIRNVKPEITNTLLSLFRLKIDNYQKILVLIKNADWKQYKEILHISEGATYYIPKNDVDIEKLIDPLFNGHLTNESIPDEFEMIIFDCVNTGMAGITSNKITLDYLQNLLGAIG